MRYLTFILVVLLAACGGGDPDPCLQEGASPTQTHCPVMSGGSHG